MLNFKVLGKFITEAGLWDKRISEFSKEDVLKLACAVAASQIEQEKTCGACWYLGWQGLKPWCLHPDHSNWIPTWTWGCGCREWSYLFDKELEPHKLNRKPKVEIGAKTASE